MKYYFSFDYEIVKYKGKAKTIIERGWYKDIKQHLYKELYIDISEFTLK